MRHKPSSTSEMILCPGEGRVTASGAYKRDPLLAAAHAVLCRAAGAVAEFCRGGRCRRDYQHGMPALPRVRARGRPPGQSGGADARLWRRSSSRLPFSEPIAEVRGRLATSLRRGMRIPTKPPGENGMVPPGVTRWCRPPPWNDVAGVVRLPGRRVLCHRLWVWVKRLGLVCLGSDTCFRRSVRSDGHCERGDP
jgi:hypothetical protein